MQKITLASISIALFFGCTTSFANDSQSMTNGERESNTANNKSAVVKVLTGKVRPTTPYQPPEPIRTKPPIGGVRG